MAFNINVHSAGLAPGALRGFAGYAGEMPAFPKYEWM